MLQEMEERRKWRHQSMEEAKREYRRLNNKLRRTNEKAREQWWETSVSMPWFCSFGWKVVYESDSNFLGLLAVGTTSIIN